METAPGIGAVVQGRIGTGLPRRPGMDKNVFSRAVGFQGPEPGGLDGARLHQLLVDVLRQLGGGDDAVGLEAAAGRVGGAGAESAVSCLR